MHTEMERQHAVIDEKLAQGERHFSDIKEVLGTQAEKIDETRETLIGMNTTLTVWMNSERERRG
jgi:hypothetical protein